MMWGFSYRFLNGTDIGSGGCGNSLGMRMPVANKMQTLPMHLVYLPLFLASVGKIQVSLPTIFQSWTGNVGDRYLVIREFSNSCPPASSESPSCC